MSSDYFKFNLKTDKLLESSGLIWYIFFRQLLTSMKIHLSLAFGIALNRIKLSECEGGLNSPFIFRIFTF